MSNDITKTLQDIKSYYMDPDQLSEADVEALKGRNTGYGASELIDEARDALKYDGEWDYSETKSIVDQFGDDGIHDEMLSQWNEDWIDQHKGYISKSVLAWDYSDADRGKIISKMGVQLDYADPEVVQGLKTALSDSDSKIRFKAAESLSRLASFDHDVVTAMTDVLNDGYLIGDETAPSQIAAVKALYLTSSFDLKSKDMDSILKVVQDDNFDMDSRVELAEVAANYSSRLGSSRSREKAVFVLSTLLSSKGVSDEHKLSILDSLCELGPSAVSALPHLQSILMGDHEELSLKASETMASVGEPAIPILKALSLSTDLDAVNSDIRPRALMALSQVERFYYVDHDEVSPEMDNTLASIRTDLKTAMVSDHSFKTRRVAGQALMTFDSFQGEGLNPANRTVLDMKALIVDRDTPISVVRSTTLALGDVGDDAINSDSELVAGALVKSLYVKDDKTQIIAINSLGRLCDSKTAVKTLTRLITHSKNPRHVSGSIVSLGQTASTLDDLDPLKLSSLKTLGHVFEGTQNLEDALQVLEGFKNITNHIYTPDSPLYREAALIVLDLVEALTNGECDIEDPKDILLTQLMDLAETLGQVA